MTYMILCMIFWSYIIERKRVKEKKKNIRIDLKNYEVFKLLNCKFIYVFMISTNYHFYIYFYNKYGKEIDKKM